MTGSQTLLLPTTIITDDLLKKPNLKKISYKKRLLLEQKDQWHEVKIL